MKVQYEADYAINDWVEVTYGDAGRLKNCCVMGVHFRQGGHVFYDLAVCTHVDDDGTKNWQRLYKVPGGLIDVPQKEGNIHPVFDQILKGMQP